MLVKPCLLPHVASYPLLLLDFCLTYPPNYDEQKKFILLASLI